MSDAPIGEWVNIICHSSMIEQTDGVLVETDFDPYGEWPENAMSQTIIDTTSETFDLIYLFNNQYVALSPDSWGKKKYLHEL